MNDVYKGHGNRIDSPDVSDIPPVYLTLKESAFRDGKAVVFECVYVQLHENETYIVETLTHRRHCGCGEPNFAFKKSSVAAVSNIRPDSQDLHII